ncbi:MAG: hypothetical protein GXO31_06030 [Epsilonproteobacteria bacterium]|nr:hypothetical protein [Campylobacterota bacterium]
MQLLLFVLVIILIFILFGIIKSNFSLKNKIIFLFILSFLIFAAFVYEAKLSEKEDKYRNLMIAFNQGKSLICHNREVNSSYFILNFGTLSFIGKDEITEVRDLIIPVKDCKLQSKLQK